MAKLTYTEAAKAYGAALAAEAALDRVIDAFEANDPLISATCEEVLYAFQQALAQDRVKARRAFIKAGG
jgi:hypothetical protein